MTHEAPTRSATVIASRVAILILALAVSTCSREPVSAGFYRVQLPGRWTHHIDPRIVAGDCYAGPKGAERFCGLLIGTSRYVPSVQPISRADLLDYVENRSTSYEAIPARARRVSMKEYPHKRGLVLDVVAVEPVTHRKYWTRLVAAGFNFWHLEYSAVSTTGEYQEARAWEILNSACPKWWND